MAASLTIEDLNIYSEKLEGVVEDVNQYSTFLETGTSGGGTLRTIFPYFKKIWTVELSEYLYQMAQPIARQIPYCTHVLGDSVIETPKFLDTLSENEKIFFWLDAHYSSGDSTHNGDHVPVVAECVVIDNHYKAQSGIVVIDDVRLFDTTHAEDWSGITEEAVLASFKNYNIEFNEIIDDRLVLFITKK
tara:strand:+ start:1069 stop:1635 length:567 start_codon:yes stop_codon:yes gene_type:complete